MTDLTRLFIPRSIALVGASEKAESIGHRTLQNLELIPPEQGVKLYLVNPTRSTIAGRECHPSIRQVPEVPDVAIVAVPAAAALAVLEDCAAMGVPFAVVLTSGFGETGEAGLAMEARMREIAQASGMRIYGPNCPGLSNVTHRIGLTFSASFRHDLKPGPIGLATQGGGLGRNVMQAMERGIGVSMWASSGNEVDLQVADFIAYMADDPSVKVIVTLLEGIKDGPRFIEAVQRAAAAGKPVVALKIGRSEYGMKAAATHTASITGSSEVNSAALRQLGVIEVDDIDELVDVAWLLCRQMPQGRGDVAVYSLSGGAAALTADIVGQHGVGMTQLQPETQRKMAERLPSYASVQNPVDVTAAAVSDATLVESTLLTLCQDPGVALVLIPEVIDVGEVTVRTAQTIVATQAQSPVPILPIWMTDRQGPAFGIYRDAGMVPSRSVGKAVKAVRRWVDYGRWQSELRARAWRPWTVLPVEEAQQVVLSEAEAKSRLAAAGLPVPQSAVAHSRAEAQKIAARFGGRVVAKVVSADILHKSDVGGVRIGLDSPEAVGRAWDEIQQSVAAAAPEARVDGILIEVMAPANGHELLVSVSLDPVFGHVMTFGLGGLYVEVFADVSRRLLPLDVREAMAMVREIKSFTLLDGARGRGKVDLEALAAFLVQISDYVREHARTLVELELNPVWIGAAPAKPLLLDAVMTVRK